VAIDTVGGKMFLPEKFADHFYQMKKKMEEGEVNRKAIERRHTRVI
jgi:hypothetical protein